MDLLKQLDHELSNMHLNDFEKVRYIYLRACQLFSFDARYNYTSLFNDASLYERIINRQIDISNVEDYLVVCHPFSRDVLIKLIRELTTAQVELLEGAHSFVEYKVNSEQIWFLDATYGDLARVKMGLDTRGFTGPQPHDKEFLSETDSILGYKPKLKKEYLSQIDISSKESIFESINILLKNSKCQKEFSDALFFIEWLLLGINYYEWNNSCYIGEDYSFYQIFKPFDSNEYFCLDNTNGYYEIKGMDEEECMRLTRGLRTKDNIIK